MIDTGSNITILSKSFLEKLPPDVASSVRPTKTKMLSVTGEVTPFQGKTELELCIGNQKLKHTLLVADIENDGILGMDFLKAHLVADIENDGILGMDFLKAHQCELA